VVAEEFVGRADELTAIGALLAGTRRERRVAALLLVGEPGIGKSRLLDEAERRSAGERILRFSGYEPESSVPLAAASSLLRRLVAASEDRTFLGLLDPDADVGGLDSIRIFESVHRQLSRLRPAALFVDDLQWVDSLSIALCHFLVRAAIGSGRGLALVVASRPSPIADRFGASLATALGDGLRPATMHLPPLDRAEGIRFVVSRSSAIERDDAAALWVRAGGSPFWLDLLIQAHGGESDFDEVVAARVQGLTADANTLLATLAIVGRPTHATELEDLIAWPPERTVAASTELVLRGLAIDDGGVTRLAHDLIRDVVIGRIPDTTRRRLHGRVATALEAQSTGEVGGLLAALEHRVASGRFDAELALRILTSPQRRLIGSDGVRRITESARDEDDSGIRTSVDQAAAALAAELGDQELALDRWSAIAQATSDRVAAARAEFGAGLAAYHLGRGDEARQWLAGCRSKAVDSPDLDISTDALEARILLWLDRRTDDGRAMAMRGVEHGRVAVGAATVTSAVRAAHIDALVAAWEAAIQAEDVDAIVALAEESLEASRDMGLREVLAARSMVGMAREYAAPQVQAADAYRVVWDEAWRAVLPIEAVDVGYRLAAVLFDMLLLDEARRVATEAEQLAARTGDQGRVRDRTRLVKYQLAMATSDWRSAMTELLAAAEAEPDPHYRLVHHQIASVWLSRLGVGEEEALGHVAEARSLAAAAGCLACGRDVEVAVAEVFARFDRAADAHDALARWDSVGRRSWVEAEWLRRRIEVLVTITTRSADVDIGAALTGLRDEADELGLGFDALWTELDMGRLLAPGDRAAAIAAYRRAAERAETAGAPTVRRLADQGLRALGERPWRRGATSAARGGTSALSDREREVAELVALGATNVEIASRLFLSRKTVEHHVSNALAKLGLHSRAELAAHVGRTHVVSTDTDGASPP
jgi:DNA-binding CsgD family transcriptional regulator/TPR repeat protein